MIVGMLYNMTEEHKKKIKQFISDLYFGFVSNTSNDFLNGN